MNSSISYIIVPMNSEHAKSICTWRYPEPYHSYNWPDWLEMQTNGFEFGDDQIRTDQYAVVLDQHLELIGFCQFFPIEGVTRLGLGLHPAHCGYGTGASFTEAVVKEAKRRSPSNTIDLEVLTWNHRAFKAYQKAGFIHTDTYERPTSDGLCMVHCMVYSNEYKVQDEYLHTEQL